MGGVKLLFFLGVLSSFMPLIAQDLTEIVVLMFKDTIY